MSYSSTALWGIEPFTGLTSDKNTQSHWLGVNPSFDLLPNSQKKKWRNVWQMERIDLLALFNIYPYCFILN